MVFYRQALYRLMHPTAPNTSVQRTISACHVGCGRPAEPTGSRHATLRLSLTFFVRRADDLLQHPSDPHLRLCRLMLRKLGGRQTTENNQDLASPLRGK